MDSESTRLLAPSEEEQPNTPNPKSNQRSSTLIKVYIALFCANISLGILYLTQTKIYESIYCWQWYETHDGGQYPNVYSYNAIPEHLCKIAPVQQKVSTLKGWLEFFDGMPSLLLAIPLGVLSDRVGRRRLCILNLSVIAIQQFWITFVTVFPMVFDLRMIWLEALLNLLSGGKIVIELLVACIITDLTPREELSTAFFRLSAVGQSAGVLSPIAAALLMKINPWVAVATGLFFATAMVFVATTVPETLHRTTIRKDDNEDDEQETSHISKSSMQNILDEVLPALQDLAIIWADWRLVFLVLLYPFRMMVNALADLVQRYVSNRYDWTLANATFLLSLQAIVATFILFLALPYTSKLIDERLRMGPIRKDLLIARVSILMLTIAFLMQGLAPTIAIFIIGLLIQTLASGLAATLRALAGNFVPHSKNGSVYSVLAISETVSSMLAFPVTAALFNVGLGKPGAMWLGLPFDVTAALALAAFIPMSLFRFERGETRANKTTDEEVRLQTNHVNR